MLKTTSMAKYLTDIKLVGLSKNISDVQEGLPCSSHYNKLLEGMSKSTDIR